MSTKTSSAPRRPSARAAAIASPRAVLKPLPVFLDDRGSLFEGLRKDDAIFDGAFGQTLVTTVYAGVVKGWHKHARQTDYTLCAVGNVKYCVAYERPGQAPEIQTFYFGEQHPAMIKVPPGLWHGYTPIGGQPAVLVHVMDTVFDPADTQRKDPLAFGDVWSVKSG